MKPLADMDELTRKRCEKCDYLNNDVPINKKKPNCVEFLNDMCELITRTEKLCSRVEYLRGERGPIFMCSRKYGLHIETWEDDAP